MLNRQRGRKGRFRVSLALAGIVICLCLTVSLVSCSFAGRQATRDSLNRQTLADREAAGAPDALEPGSNREANVLSPEQTGSAASPDAGGSAQAEIIAAQKEHERKVEVTVDARVYKLLPDDTIGLPHQRFLIELENGSTVLVAHDTKLAPHVPLSQGDMVRIHGEYIWNNRGGVLHWTHHNPGGRHEGGWIDFNGQRYQ